MKYRIRSVGLGSAAKFGIVLGMLASLLPACLVGLASIQGVSLARRFMEEAARARVVVFGQMVSVNLVEMARLGPTLESLRLLDGLGVALALTTGLAFLAALSVLCAFTVLLVAVGYNLVAALSGGLALKLEGDGSLGEEPAGGRYQEAGGQGFGQD